MQSSGRTQPLDTLEKLYWYDYSKSASNYKDCFPQRKKDFDVSELSQNSWRYNKILSETSINAWHWHIRSQDNIYQEPDKPEASSSLIKLNQVVFLKFFHLGMIEAIGIVSGISTEWFLEELHLQQVGKALSRSTCSHKDFTQTEGALGMSCSSTFPLEHRQS